MAVVATGIRHTGLVTILQKPVAGLDYIFLIYNVLNIIHQISYNVLPINVCYVLMNSTYVST